MNKKRPLNINPLTIKLPIPALVSICHRVSGVVVFLFIPAILCLLGHSLESKASFDEMLAWMQAPVWKIFIWVLAVGLYFHVVAGLRHLLMDIHLGESLIAARISAMVVFGLSFAFAVWAALALGGVI